MKLPRRWASSVTLSILALLGVWAILFVSQRAGRNDLLLREARFLHAASKQFTNDFKQFSNFPIHQVNGNPGAIIPINENVIIDREDHFALIGWTNSCMGSGTLMLAQDEVFLWRNANGVTRKLRIPDLRHVPIYWYVVDP